MEQLLDAILRRVPSNPMLLDAVRRPCWPSVLRQRTSALGNRSTTQGKLPLEAKLGNWRVPTKHKPSCHEGFSWSICVLGTLALIVVVGSISRRTSRTA